MVNRQPVLEIGQHTCDNAGGECGSIAGDTFIQLSTSAYRDK